MSNSNQLGQHSTYNPNQQLINDLIPIRANFSNDLVLGYGGGFYPPIHILLNQRIGNDGILGRFVDQLNQPYLIVLQNFPKECSYLTDPFASREVFFSNFSNFLHFRTKDLEILLFTSGDYAINMFRGNEWFVYTNQKYNILTNPPNLPSSISATNLQTSPFTSPFTFLREYDTVGYLIKNKKPYHLVVDQLDRRLVHAISDQGICEFYYLYKYPIPQANYFSLDQARIYAFNNKDLTNSTFNGLCLPNGQPYAEEVIELEYSRDLPVLPSAYSTIENHAYGHWS